MNTIAGPPGSPVYVPWPCPVCLRGRCTGGTGCTQGRRSGRWSFLLALVILAGCQQANWNDDPKWDHTPITVDWSADLNDAMPWAMDSWNHAAGCTVLVRAHGTPDVTVGPYDGTACGRPAQLEATGDAVAGAWRCSPTHAEVRFKVLSDIRSNGIAATHEMGHVLGLAHDRSALMQAAPQLYHPEQLSRNSGLLPWPSDADGAAVGKRYCR